MCQDVSDARDVLMVLPFHVAEVHWHCCVVVLVRGAAGRRRGNAHVLDVDEYIVEVDVEVADEYAALFELVVAFAALAVGVLLAAAVGLVLVAALVFVSARRAGSFLSTHVRRLPFVVRQLAVSSRLLRLISLRLQRLDLNLYVVNVLPAEIV